VYTDFYRLNLPPFQLSPDPRFFFVSSGHKKALAYLTYGISQGEGFVVVTGEVGAGKTTLVRHLLADLDPETYVTAHIVNSRLGATASMRSAAASFGIPHASLDKATLLARIETFLTAQHNAGRKVILVIDEAQNIPFNALEELRMLSNFQINATSLLQCILVGQPQFRDIMAQPAFEQIRQRVVASCHLYPLNEVETRTYIEHRLKVAGWANDPEFAPDAFTAIHRWTSGVPRRINTLCGRLLLFGFLEGKHRFEADDVKQVAAEMARETGPLSVGIADEDAP
jgi:putative secretion ATPase (PEP-CTERM system associated)